MRLPLRASSSVRRLAAIQTSLDEVKNSTIPTTFFYLIKLAGIQFGWIAWKFFWNSLPTAVMSNFPGPEESANFMDLPILDGGFAAGFGPANASKLYKNFKEDRF